MDYDAIIIGAGAIGLAVGKALLGKTNKIAIIEKNISFGMETSSRNSEVIHSGIYYPIDSLKSKLCIEGSRLLYKYCDIKKIPYNKCGKLIIAQNEKEKIELISLENNAKILKINYSMLTRNDIQKKEPLIKADHAIYIKETGVIDSHQFMSAMYQDISDEDINVAYKTEVIDITLIPNGYTIKIKNPDSSFSQITTKIIINCAGLFANNISSMVGLTDANLVSHFWKGSYFWISNKKASSIKSLIYPMPNKQLSGLGIHTTKGIDGRVKVGPDTEYLGKDYQFDYSVDIQKKQYFYESCKKYLPFLELDDLQPEFSGIRPKLQKPNEKVKDFIILNEKNKGYNNFINLIGIESPGLTASLAIGKYVRGLISWDL